MTVSVIKKSPTLKIGADVKNDLVDKILNRLQYIDESKKLLPKDEEVLGIFKTKGVTINHIVITDYRIFGVKIVESYGNVVFANEITENDIQSITAQAIKGLFSKVFYVLEIEKNGKKTKYATVKSTDVDNVVKLIEEMKSSETMASLIEAQKRLEAEEKAERNRIATEQKQQQSEQVAQARQAQKQALADANQLANNRASSGQCPKCGSNNLQAIHSATNKGFSDTSACGGCCLLGPVGLLCGLCGSGQKQEQSYRMCLNCGNKF